MNQNEMAKIALIEQRLTNIEGHLIRIINLIEKIVNILGEISRKK